MLTIKSVLSVTAGILALVGFVPYIVAILHGETKPAKATWIIWASLSVITLFGMLATNAINGQICGAALGDTIVAVLAVKFGGAGWTKLDLFCLGGAIVGITMWQTTGNPVLSILICLVVIFIGSVPTFVSAFHNPDRENHLAWVIFWLSSVVAVVAIPALAWQDAAQPITFLTCTIIMMYLLYLNPRIKKPNFEKVEA